MTERIEDKLRAWAKILIVLGWLGAVAVCLLFLVTGELMGADADAFFPLLLVGIGFACSFLMSAYMFSRLTSAFADITQNTREATTEIRQLNINIQKAFLSNIQATERTMVEKERAEREQAERTRQETEQKEAERRREVFRRREEYWLAHAEEKEALLAKREQATKALQSLGKLSSKEKSQLEELIQ